jgi:DNA-binding GntR family transcriptional regulator
MISNGVKNMINRVTVKEKICDQVFNDITEGLFVPNDILTESVLAEKYAASKSTVREALIELCKDDILKSIPRLGYQVVPITLKEAMDILDFRLDLELCSLKKAFPNIMDEDIRTCRAAGMPPKIPEQGVLPNWMINQNFHLSLCKLSGNDYTYKILKYTLKQSSRYVSQYFNTAWRKSSESEGEFHMKIITALENRDFEQACRMLINDIAAVKNELQQIYSF